MPKRVKHFLVTTLLGGITVILPVALMAQLFNWLVQKITTLISPLTHFFVERVQAPKFLMDMMVIGLILVGCFLVGFLERTKMGNMLFTLFEDVLLKKIPGYKLIKETIVQFTGGSKTPFGGVALVRLFDSETLTTAFITEEHPDGHFTVFVPTAPNPTSGLIYHLQQERVHRVDVSTEIAMRSVISCGVGSKTILEKHFSKLHN